MKWTIVIDNFNTWMKGLNEKSSHTFLAPTSVMGNMEKN